MTRFRRPRLLTHWRLPGLAVVPDIGRSHESSRVITDDLGSNKRLDCRLDTRYHAADSVISKFLSYGVDVDLAFRLNREEADSSYLLVVCKPPTNLPNFPNFELRDPSLSAHLRRSRTRRTRGALPQNAYLTTSLTAVARLDSPTRLCSDPGFFIPQRPTNKDP
ncbi:unnamed protein product [Alternaria burnsii]|nr:unnamed protein product [Alternaria burnsii]